MSEKRRTDTELADELERYLQGFHSWQPVSRSKLAHAVGACPKRVKRILEGDKRFRSYMEKKGRVTFVTWHLW